LLGYPATYSLSPALHNAAYTQLGVDAVYVVFPTLPEHLREAVMAVRALNMLGVSVTIPHKEQAGTFCDELTDSARALGAVNCIANVDGTLMGHNTDGAGFVAALRHELQFEPLGKRCVVLGAGGAAKAVVVALAAAGATDIAVVNRSQDRANTCAQLAPGRARIGEPQDALQADLVVNATPLGMVGEWQAETPLDASCFREGQVAVDLIYQPARTRFLQEAEAAGVRTANGLGMLIHQAAAQIEIWLGEDAPIDTMRRAVSG
jgi:shikimate dehydrogenase